MNLPLTRTLWLIPATPASCKALAIATVTCTFAVAVLESAEKRRVLRPKYHGLTKERLQGIWGHALFAHTLSSFRSGFTGILQQDNIPEVDPTLRGDKSGAALRKAWKRSAGKYRLIKATARAYRLTLLSAVLPRLLLLGASFAQAFLISVSIRFIKTPIDERLPGSGPALVGAYILTYVVFSVSKSHLVVHSLPPLTTSALDSVVLAPAVPSPSHDSRRRDLTGILAHSGSKRERCRRLLGCDHDGNRHRTHRYESEAYARGMGFLAASRNCRMAAGSPGLHCMHSSCGRGVK